jgi:3-dehydroquinate dehydratase II
MKTVVVLNGPNLQRLGTREPDVYGSLSYQELTEKLEQHGSSLGLSLEIHQSDSEAELIGLIHDAADRKLDLVINPAAFTHYSYAIGDACALLKDQGQRIIEVHISNPHAREEFRHKSVVSAYATGVIAGFGLDSYKLALQQLAS